MATRFSTDGREDVLEGIRRIVADVLVGNGDNHLKNWSFFFPKPGEVRLSPAYDIVPTVLFIPNDTIALRFAGVQQFGRVRLKHFRRLASLLKLDPGWIEREVRAVGRQALQTWPELIRSLPLTEAQANQMLARWDSLDLVAELRNGAAVGLHATATR